MPFSVMADGLAAWVASLPPRIVPDTPPQQLPTAEELHIENPDDPITPEQVEIVKAKLAAIAESWAA